MTRVRIIGIGSPWGDDRIGWDAVREIEASGLPERYFPGAVEACCCDRPGTLLALLQGVDAAILVDAMRAGGAAGTVRKLARHELVLESGLLSSHGIGVADTIALGAALDLLPAALSVYGIEAPHAVPATEPGGQVRAAIPTLLAAVAADLEALFDGFSRRLPGKG